MNKIHLEHGGTIYWGSPEELAAQGIPPNVILAAAKGDQRRNKLGELYRHAASVVELSAGVYAPQESARWTRLVDECRAYQADGTASAFLSHVCSDAARPDYCAGVLAKADAYEALLAQIIRKREEHSAAINALASVEAVMAYDVATGWPEI